MKHTRRELVIPLGAGQWIEMQRFQREQMERIFGISERIQCWVWW